MTTQNSQGSPPAPKSSSHFLSRPATDDLKKVVHKSVDAGTAAIKFVGCLLVSVIVIGIFAGPVLTGSGGFGWILVIWGAFWLYEKPETGSRTRPTQPEPNRPRQPATPMSATWPGRTLSSLSKASAHYYQRTDDVPGEEVAAPTSMWIEHAAWPLTPIRSGSPFPTRPLRSAAENDTSCTYYSRLVGREIQCESQLERSFFKRVEDSKVAEFFLEQPARIRYEWESKPRYYYPDAAVQLKDGRWLLVEVKPTYRFNSARDQAKWKAAVAWSHRNGIGFLVVDPKRGHILGSKFFDKKDMTSA